MSAPRIVKAAVAASLSIAVGASVLVLTPTREPHAVAAPAPVVAGVSINNVTTGLRDTAPPLRHRILGTDGGALDNLAGQYLSDVLDFWDETPLPQGKGYLLPPNQVASFNSRTGEGQTICMPSSSINAGACRKLNGMTSVEWDRGVLLPGITRGRNSLGAGTIIAHEVGHLVDFQLRGAPNLVKETPLTTLVKEQRADCFAGSWLAYVADGRSRRFTLSPDGLAAALLYSMVFRDPIMKAGHGIGVERMNAILQGFSMGVDHCSTIDAATVSLNRYGITKDGNAENPLRWRPFTNEFISELRAAVGSLTGSVPDMTTEPCGNTEDPESPARWCVSRTEVSANMGILGSVVEKSRTSDKDLPVQIAKGPGTLVSPLLAAMVQPFIREQGKRSTSLNTACVVGFVARSLTYDLNGDVLDFGVLDEIAAEMLSEGRGANAADGTRDPHAVNRVNAYLDGVYRAGSAADCL